jgi:E3 ubiquitin-protein ligase XIAP
MYYLNIGNLRNSFSLTGSLDKVVCFHCGGGLMNWIPSDDPWMEHAFHFPLCVFVRYIKGENYVKSCKTKRQTHTVTNKEWNCNLM